MPLAINLSRYTGRDCRVFMRKMAWAQSRDVVLTHSARSYRIPRIGLVIQTLCATGTAPADAGQSM